jgi:hypothetical protein
MAFRIRDLLDAGEGFSIELGGEECGKEVGGIRVMALGGGDPN